VLESPERFSATCLTIAGALAVVGLVGVVDRLLVLPLAGLFAVFAVLARLVARERREHLLAWTDAVPVDDSAVVVPDPPAPAPPEPTPAPPEPTPVPPEPAPLLVPTSPPGVRRTFRLPVVGEAQRACLVGDFNDWSHTATPMRRAGDHFEVEVELQPGRSYRYRYLVDGTRWENDWAAHRYVPNGYGQDDSVIDV
jgi:hypothetical protein